MTDSEKIALIRSIVVSNSIKSSEQLGLGATSAIAWKTIGEIIRVLQDSPALASEGQSGERSDG